MRPEAGILPAVCRGRTIGATTYERSGTGPAIVFVHGVGMDLTVWAPQVTAFASRHTVVAYDLLGHGGSALPPEAPRLSDYAEQLGSLLDGLGIARAVVVGHSMGALVATEFALSNPSRVAALVALNAVFRRSPESRAAIEARADALLRDGVAGTIEATLGRWFGDPVPPALAPVAAAVGARLAAVDPIGYARSYGLFARADDAHGDRLAHLAVPAYFLTGALDPNSSPAMSEAMARLAPRGVAEAIPGERHMMSIVSPEAVNRRLSAFIAGAAAVPQSGQPAAIGG